MSQHRSLDNYDVGQSEGAPALCLEIRAGTGYQKLSTGIIGALRVVYGARRERVAVFGLMDL